MADGFSRPTFKYSHQSGVVTNVQLKATSGVLRAITINTTGATIGPISILDNTASGGVLSQSSNPIAVITPVASAAPVTLQLDVTFGTGLVVNSSTAANTMDYTVSFQ